MTSTSPGFGRDAGPKPAPEELAAAAADIQARYSTRQERSRAACWWLFAQGIKPSQTSVRQLTNLGSPPDIQRDLNAFWEEVRNRAAVPLPNVDLPDEVRAAIASAMGDVMRVMREQARGEFAGERERAAAEVRTAQEEAERARIQLEDALAQGRELARQFAEATEARNAEAAARGAAEASLVAARAEIERLNGELSESRQRAAAIERDLAEERRGRDADREAAEQRVAAERARADADIRAVRIALDASRQEVKRCERDLAAAAAKLDEERAAHAAEMAKASDEATGLRARIGELGAGLAAAVAAREAGEALLRSLESRLDSLPRRSDHRQRRKTAIE